MITIEDLQKIMETEGLPNTTIKGQSPEEGGLMVNMGRDTAQRDYWVRMELQPQLLFDGQEPVTDGEQAPGFYSLTYSVEYPFSVKPYTVADTARLIAFLNHAIHLPGFELDEVELTIHYRYVLMLSVKAIAQQAVIGVIGNMLLFREIYGEAIEKVATGQMSMNEVLEEVITSAKEILESQHG